MKFLLGLFPTTVAAMYSRELNRAYNRNVNGTPSRKKPSHYFLTLLVFPSVLKLCILDILCKTVSKINNSFTVIYITDEKKLQTN